MFFATTSRSTKPIIIWTCPVYIAVTVITNLFQVICEFLLTSTRLNAGGNERVLTKGGGGVKGVAAPPPPWHFFDSVLKKVWYAGGGSPLSSCL